MNILRATIALAIVLVGHAGLDERGAAGQDAAISGSPKAAPAVLYFPTRVGDRRVYRYGEKEFTDIVDRVEQVGETKVVTVTRRTGKGTPDLAERIAVSEKGLARLESFGWRLDPPVWLLKLPAKTGFEWSRARDSDTGKYLDIRTIRGSEMIEVPAGRYSAVKVTLRTTIDNRQKGVFWFAPGVGLVKSEYGDKTQILKSFTPAKD
jgi:hypothetical protein